MTGKEQFRAIRGTRDILPPDSALWNWFEHSAREVFESYNFREIRTPTLEYAELFYRSVGSDTDVVNKEMYFFPEQGNQELERLRNAILTFPVPFPARLHSKELLELTRAYRHQLDIGMSRGEIPTVDLNILGIGKLDEALRDIDHLLSLGFSPENIELIEANVQKVIRCVNMIHTGHLMSLRPEATASVVRAYIEHGMHNLPGNQKLYYVGPMFRRERPQKGRYRQFYQIGAEVLGPSDAPAIDAEVIEMLLALFRRVGLTRTALYINSIGCKDCRPKYVERLREELRKVKDRLGTDSQRRIETNPLRVLDSKMPEEQEIIATLPRIPDHLCEACRAHFARLKEELALRDISYEENWRLVRGLDYYTRTTFEVTAEGLGSQNAVCGGGRYDGLVELLGGPPTKGIGFAIGTDRAILSIQESGNLPKLPGLDVFIAWMSAKCYPAAVEISRKLREAGLVLELPAEEMKFKKSLGLADRLGARYALIIGEDEVSSGTFALKRLADAKQDKYSESELLAHLTSERTT